MLISTLSFCQISYPKKIKFKGDTCIAISIEQTIKLNFKLSRKRFIESQYSIMVDQNRQYLKMIHELSKQVAERDKLINKYEQHASKINELILAEQDKSNKLKKKLKDKKKWELIMLGAIGALTGLLIFSG